MICSGRLSTTTTFVRGGFTRCNGDPPEGPGGQSLWKQRVVGTSAAIQLTPAAPRTDFFPVWSPDGQTIYFQRQDAAIGPQITLWKVPAAGGSASQVFIPPAPADPDTFDATVPGVSPDGAILVMGYGKRDHFEPIVRDIMTHTLDVALSSPTPEKVIRNYADPTFAEARALLSPRLSPDGTRLLLGSKQIWVARRNMNLPPRFTTVDSPEEGTRSIADTAATMGFFVQHSIASAIEVSATDPEGDALTYRASFLQSWMSWNDATQTLILTPPMSANNMTFFVKFWVTTASGGTDSFVASIRVIAVPPGPMAAREAKPMEAGPSLANPSRGAFAVATPWLSGVTARLMVFDLTGRRVALVSGPSGTGLTWDGHDRRTSSPAAPGVYFYRLEAGLHRREGKFALVR